MSVLSSQTTLHKEVSLFQLQQQEDSTWLSFKSKNESNERLQVWILNQR